MAKRRTTHGGIELIQHIEATPPIVATQAQKDTAKKGLFAFFDENLSPADAKEQKSKDWNGSVFKFVSLVRVDTLKLDSEENFHYSALEVARKGMPHNEGPDAHSHWYARGGYFEQEEGGGEPPYVPGQYPPEPPPVDPPYSKPADLYTLYPENSRFRPLIPGEGELSVARAAYGIDHAGQRQAFTDRNLDQRHEQAQTTPEPGISKDMWAHGWEIGAQGFDLSDPFGTGPQLRKVYVGREPVEWVEEQIRLASGGGAPSGG